MHTLEERIVTALEDPEVAAPIPAIISDLEIDTKDAIAMASLSRKTRSDSEEESMPAPQGSTEEEKKQKGGEEK